MTITALIWAIVKIAVMVGFLINVAGILTWYDRRGGAMMQDRVGPNRAFVAIGKFRLRIAGLLHTAADGVKFFTKEDFMPPKADKFLFSLAPILAFMPVFALVAVIPFGDAIDTNIILKNVAAPRFNEIHGAAASSRLIDLVVVPLNVGLLYVFALAGQGIVGAAIAGWASDNKFSLMGALRASSQMVSYEVTMGLTLVGALMIYGTIRLDEMVRWQGENAWGIYTQPLAFFLFFAALIAESKRIPFDLPEAESELVSGYFTEYSGMKFGMFYFAEYAEIVTSSMLLVTIFLGGWTLPFLHRDGLTVAIGDTVLIHQSIPHLGMILIGVLTFFGKTLVLCWVQAFVRWSLPRFRYDGLMKLGWQVLLPASLANIFITAVVWIALDRGGESVASGASRLRVLADITQGITAFVLTALVIWAVVGFARKPRRARTIVGSSAKYAAAAGGAKQLPIRAAT
ncbi:MAG: NADH-quinone oxidoreductase subunit H [Polyangiaceae bacterium]|nr:NADH-quinone oxidoreductase subunit H [Polyangiaceae bacterium]